MFTQRARPQIWRRAGCCWRVFSIHRQDQCATRLKYCQREYYLSIMESGGLGDFEDRQEIFDYADVYARDCYVEDTDFM